jgi:ABC-2 type transport system ATP-binding protein
MPTTTPSRPREPIVQVDGLSVTYGEHRALDGLDLSIGAGSVHGLLGPNGSGKTTLVKVLATLLRPAAGSATVAGHDVVDDPEATRGAIGLAGQYAAVDNLLTGRENLEIVGRLYGLARRTAQERADEVLERLSLTDAGDHQVGTYSGGMRRRLDLGASLVGRPLVLFLDEPTTGLDPRTRIELWDFLRDLVAEGTTVLLTTQYLEEADALAERITVIDHGRTIAEGTADELKDDLGSSTLVATPEDRADLEAIARLLDRMTGTPARIDEIAGTASVPVADRVMDLVAVATALQAETIQVSDLGVVRPSLDDVFLSLTRTASTDTKEQR